LTFAGVASNVFETAELTEMTSTERSRAFKANQKARGLVQCNIWMSKAQCAEFKRLFEMLAENPDLRVVSVATQDVKTGRMRGVKL
jgi:hypothetical protein